MVEQALGLDPFAKAVYVFRNRRRDRVKILGWHRNGFWLLIKRLEQDRFIWPEEAKVETCKVNGIDGYRYLRALLAALPRAKTVDDYEALLPWRLAMPSA